MELHILNGDALKKQMEGAAISGRFIVFRECLIEGPVVLDTSSQVFWQQRAAYLEKTYGEPPKRYRSTLAGPMEQLEAAHKAMPINLWFENDLFCQANMWFVLKFIRQKKLPNKIYRIFPQPKGQAEDWKGFGKVLPTGLPALHQNRVLFKEDGLNAGVQLWNGFVQKDFQLMEGIAAKGLPCFDHLPEVVEAFRQLHPKTKESLSRPDKRLKKILASGKTEFGDIFRAFTETEGIYGFGDLTIRQMLQKNIENG
ncbi:MAG: hypothetical protein H6573_26040 [Lewinellaceae bacterium]|nr:hypothetical protein [Phaeodactylibacter sp.]MCB9350937.1 hypothetical protein [Lewinellaceae bacterium]